MSVGTIEEGRRALAASLLAEPKLDALLVTSLHNVRYLTGFIGSNASVLILQGGGAVLFTDPRYTVQAQQQVTCQIRIAKGPLTAAILQEVKRSRLGRVGFEADHLTVAQFDAMRHGLPPRSELFPISGFIEHLRMVKDPGEIELIRDSVLANSQALERALRRLKPGMREADMAAEIDYQNRRLGAEAPAFDTIVAAGERSALPHAHPGAAGIHPGILLIDMGAFLAGYASDMTRMVHIGRAPARYRRAYRAVLEAQMAAIDTVKPGASTAAVDLAARTTLRQHGLEREFIHSTGHGLGLEIHEPPRIGRKDKTKLQAGMTITVEPGVYVEGWGGIRIEDTVLVTETGCEILTPTSKELREI